MLNSSNLRLNAGLDDVVQHSQVGHHNNSQVGHHLCSEFAVLFQNWAPFVYYCPVCLELGLYGPNRFLASSHGTILHWNVSSDPKIEKYLARVVNFHLSLPWQRLANECTALLSLHGSMAIPSRLDTASHHQNLGENLFHDVSKCFFFGSVC